MEKKKNNIFFKIMGLLFIIFIGLYIANVSGYYESKIRNEVIITEEGITAFEEKIAKGESVDMNSFLKNNKVDYSNRVSDLGDKITSYIEVFIDKGSKVVTNIVKSLF
jgi:hypothetical protein